MGTETDHSLKSLDLSGGSTPSQEDELMDSDTRLNQILAATELEKRIKEGKASASTGNNPMEISGAQGSLESASSGAVLDVSKPLYDEWGTMTNSSQNSTPRRGKTLPPASPRVLLTKRSGSKSPSPENRKKDESILKALHTRVRQLEEMSKEDKVAIVDLRIKLATSNNEVEMLGKGMESIGNL